MNRTVQPAQVSARPVMYRKIPGEGGVWILICGEFLVFSIFFMIFLYSRAQSVEIFAQSQLCLNQTLGALNTFIMLSSSWFVALAVQAARRNMGRVTPFLFIAAFTCGILFGIIKCLEYSEKIRAGITLSTNDFYMYYFVFTGIHMMHVLVGMAVLALLTGYTWLGTSNGTKITNIESGAIFWHLVDLLWIILFALLYLVK